MGTIYHVHVGHDWAPGDDLLSLYEVYGDAAYEMYAERWPDARELAIYHAHYVHCHATLVEAVKYQSEYGGQILEIETDELDVFIDRLEYPHPCVRDMIPAEYITQMAVARRL